MKNCQKINCIVFVLAIIFTAIFSVAAQQLKPKEIIYSRLQTNLQAAPTGANQPTIWTTGQDGANDRQITTGTQPRISDDGRYLLFKRFPGSPNNPYGNPWGGDGQLWVRELATGTETMIFSWYYAGYVLGYYFSPESNQGNYQIILSYITLTYKMNLDGTGATPIPGQLERDFFPVVRRGDSKIVSHAQGENGLATLAFDMATRTVIPNTQTNDYNPSWSNDNQLVGFGSVFPANANPFNLYPPYPYVFGKLGKTKPDGTGRTQLLDLTGGSTNGGTDGVTFGTIWTNDNSKIIVAAKIGGVSGLYAVKTDGSGTYTKIPISNGNAPDWVGGIVQPRNDAQLISNGGGVMTDQNGNFTYDGNNVVNSDGSIDPVQPDVAQALRFSLVDSIGEPIAGDAISGGGYSFQSGFIAEDQSSQTNESDVASRPNGDGAIQSNDVVQMIRFVNELDTPSVTPNEFQRADSAPRTSGGNGSIDSSDIVQTIRYLNELDATQIAGGPSVPSGGNRVTATYEGNNSGKEESANFTKILLPAVAPELRVESTMGSAGNQVSVNIRVDATGNEAQYAFAVLVDPNVLTYASFAAGGTTSQTFSCNGTATAGRVRCSIGAFTGNQAGSNTNTIGEIAPGNNQILIKVNFTVAANAQANSTTAVNLGSQSASDDSANSITPAVTNGTVTIAGATAAGAAISGRVLTGTGRGVANARVTLTDVDGVKREVITNGFGYYSFMGVSTGRTVIVNVYSKNYSFTTQTVNLTGDLNEFNFTAQN